MYEQFRTPNRHKVRQVQFLQYRCSFNLTMLRNPTQQLVPAGKANVRTNPGAKYQAELLLALLLPQVHDFSNVMLK